MDAQLISRPACPHCKKLLDGFIAMEGDHVPSPGDVSVCAYCFEYLEFDIGMKLIPITSTAIQAIDLPELQRAKTFSGMFQKKFEGK